MNKQDFIKILQQPLNISIEDLKKLEYMAEAFPFCQAAHVLIAKGNVDYGNMLADQKIKKAAVYTLDRKNLKKIISFQGLKLVKPETNKTESKDLLFPKKEEKIASTNTLEASSEKVKIKGEKSDIKEYTNTSEGKKETTREAEKTLRNNLLIDSFLKNLKTNLPEETEKKKAPQAEKTDFIEKKPIEKDTTISGFEKEVVISETELLLNYLDFLKSNRTTFKRNPEKINQIIDRFIKEEPAISPLKFKAEQEEEKDLVTPAISNKGIPVSETFANLLVKQGKILKAIEIFQKLILKNPEKKTYFASQIEELKKQL